MKAKKGKEKTSGKKNMYTCQACQGHVITIDLDAGVTPFAMICKAKDGCEGIMYSSMYQCDQTLEPQYEWFKPTDLTGYNQEMLYHIQMGGLDIRPIKKE